ncbi:capsular polysaccharide synthesis protein [Bifidobacterium pseudolongum]|uniref:capsular polysaccharide synthesis protein n=1 Tax=Bifidobacterium pseudolongum TaxID=1694 RepID=UPI0009B74EAF
MTDKLRHLLKLASNFSLSYLLCHLELSARSRLFPQHPSQRLLQCRNKYIRHIIADLAKHLPPSTEEIRPALPDSNIIWTMWSQGEHKAPPIIQQCIASMRQQDATVIVIDDTNIHDYIGPYPDSINRGLKDKTISLAHLSDYVRFTLLGRYGGLWLDSTVLSTGHCRIVLSSSPFTHFVKAITPILIIQKYGGKPSYLVPKVRAPCSIQPRKSLSPTGRNILLGEI